MRYDAPVLEAFEHALAALPEGVRADVWADKYKYLTDVTLLREAMPEPGGRILEIGGARSPNALMLRELGLGDAHIVDRFDQPDSERLEQRPHPTRALWPAAGIPAIQSDVAAVALPYPDQSFSLVCAVDVMEHFTVPSRFFFSEIHRVLRPGGVVLAGCPNHANLQNRIKLLLGHSVHSRLETWHGADRYIGHIREFTPAEIERMLSGAGFEVLRRRMGEEELDSVVRDRAKLQRDRTAGSNRLDLTRPGELAFYLVVLLYYGVVKLFPGCRYFTRVLARRPLAAA